MFGSFIVFFLGPYAGLPWHQPFKLGLAEPLPGSDRRRSGGVRAKERQRNEAFRRRIQSAIEVDSARLIGRLQLAEDELLTLTAADLERMTKLFLALGGEPLAEKHDMDLTSGGQPIGFVPIFGPNDP
jgi:hypothetical protein